MKNFRKPYFSMVMAVLVLFVSCNQYDDAIPEEQVAIVDYKIALKNFKRSYEKVKPKLLRHKDLSSKSSKENLEIELLLKTLATPSLELMVADGFNKNELIEMLGKNYLKNELKSGVIGLLYYELKTNSNDNYQSKTNKENPIIECFIEATGIAAGVALIGVLVGQAGGKALRKAFIAAVKKIGPKVAAGLGLILIAAEFVYCMGSSDES